MLEINYNEKKIVKKKSQKKVKMPKMALFCALHFSTEQNICFGHIVRHKARVKNYEQVGKKPGALHLQVPL